MSLSRRDEIVRLNREELGDAYAGLRFGDAAQLARAEARRAELLAALRGAGAAFGFGGTKVDCRGRSPGCQACGAGRWSCLFVTGRCDAGCFFCPSPQDAAGVPETQGIRFERVRDYLAYLERFGFGGVGLSGGEPLGTLDRTRHFAREVKRRFGAAVHLWMYTNGLLVTPDVLRALASDGLDEVRIDLAATGYRLEPLRVACAEVPRVTVEIPAIPEHLPRLRRLLPELVALGVRHLNLHQLRLTPYNLPQLRRRDYTFVHGDRVTVLESELAALELLRHALDEGLALPINYCSFAYKRRSQAAGAGQRHARFIAEPFEAVAPSGLIRRLTLRGDPAVLGELARALGDAPERLRLERSAAALHLHPALLARVPVGAATLAVRYDAAALCSAVTYRHPFREVPLHRRRALYVERRPRLPETALTAAEEALLRRLIEAAPALGEDGVDPPGAEDVAATWRAPSELGERLLDHELPPRGLPAYV